MKKFILSSLFVLMSLCGFTQELTADTPAVEPSLLTQILQALWAGLYANLK